MRLFEGIGELANDEIMNFGILDGVEHMKERNDDDEDE